MIIKVKYVGKGDAIVVEYDGIKYTFSKRSPIQEIPIIVYNYMMDLNNPYRDDILPFQEEAKEEIKEPEETEQAKEISKPKKRRRRVKKEKKDG